MLSSSLLDMQSAVLGTCDLDHSVWDLRNATNLACNQVERASRSGTDVNQGYQGHNRHRTRQACLHRRVNDRSDDFRKEVQWRLGTYTRSVLARNWGKLSGIWRLAHICRSWEKLCQVSLWTYWASVRKLVSVTVSWSHNLWQSANQRIWWSQRINSVPSERLVQPPVSRQEPLG